jgi:hypothetical protein
MMNQSQIQIQKCKVMVIGSSKNIKDKNHGQVIHYYDTASFSLGRSRSQTCCSIGVLLTCFTRYVLYVILNTKVKI